MKTLIDVVLFYMNTFPDLRLHQNRDKLVGMVREEYKEMTGKSCSYESVTRVQRKLWGDGVCLPENNKDFLKWLKSRSQEQTYLQFYTNQKKVEV